MSKRREMDMPWSIMAHEIILTLIVAVITMLVVLAAIYGWSLFA